MRLDLFMPAARRYNTKIKPFIRGSYFYSICQKGSVTRVWPRSGHVDRSGLQLWYIAPERRQEHVYLGVLAVTGRLEAGH